MRKNIPWLVVSGLVALTLLMAACGPASAPTTPTAPTPPATPSAPTAPTAPKPAEERTQKEAVAPAVETPKYGGVVNSPMTADPTRWDPLLQLTAATRQLTNEALWEGDWTKGPAGGYGTGEVNWNFSYDNFDRKAGVVAESWKWTIDSVKNQAVLVYQIRQGIHFALDPANEASRLASGRELTADDVVFCLNTVVRDPRSYVYGATPSLRVAEITKSSPWEVTVKVPTSELVSALSRLGNFGRIVPPEVFQKYGDMLNWRNAVGSGTFILKEYVPGSILILDKNPNYWGKNPIGPGKGNQLPYVDRVRFAIIPDVSTRQAALRTGRIDRMTDISWEDAIQLRKTTPALVEKESGDIGSGGIYPNTQRKPFADTRVRQAMMLAIDLESIRKNLYGGYGQINTFPWPYYAEYAELNISLDSPDMPASTKELFKYDPEKARQLLKESGYPNGFKTTLLLTSGAVDEMSIVKDMWSKVGIDVTLDVRETGAQASLARAGEYDITIGGRNPPGLFFTPVTLVGQDKSYGQVNDPKLNTAFDEIRQIAATGEKKALQMTRTLVPYIIEQVYGIPRPDYGRLIFWWPWLKNYSGEENVGFGNTTRDN